MWLDRFRHPGEFFGLVLAAFLLGIAAHSIWPFAPWPDVWFAVGLGPCFIGLRAAKSGSQRRGLVILVAVIAGALRFNLTLPLPEQGLLPYIGESAVLRGRIVSSTEANGRITAVAKIEAVGVNAVTGPGANLYLRPDKSVWPGSSVEFTCTLRTPGTFPSNLERRRSLARKGIWSECSAKTSLKILALPKAYDPLFALARLRERITERIASVLPPDEAALTTGILYGDQDLTPQLKDLFQRAGLTHLVAVSGSNVTILVDVLLVMALYVGLPRRRAFWLVSAGLLVFVGFVGFSASILRAAFMGWLAALARELGRKAWTDRLLLAAAATLCLFNPWVLAFDVGFALSFLATWGLLAWTPIFEKRLSVFPRALSLRVTAATTCGATLMTAPYLAWVFGRLSLAGLLTNILALPLVPWAMLWGAICAAWGDWPGHLATAAPALGFAKAIILISKIANIAPWLSSTVPGMDFGLLVATYLAIFYLWLGLREEKVE